MHPLVYYIFTFFYCFRLAYAQFQSFVTRPHDKAVKINILQNTAPQSLAPGYYFITPIVNGGPSFGPQIFDSNGTLIWYGNDTVTARANGLSLCSYAGTPSLCYNDGQPAPQGGHSSGLNRFLSAAYTDVDPAHVYGAKNGLVGPDNHEDNTPNGNFVLETVFQPRQLDLTAYGGAQGGWVWDGCFQQTKIPDASVMFQWCALEQGVALNETATYMWGRGKPTNPIAGNGSLAAPWDFFHINSVAWDKGTGDFLVSSRHCNTVYRVCGSSSGSAECNGRGEGDIAWRLGGRRSDFEGDVAFSGQHMARWHNGYEGDGANSTISLFDDASDGVSSSQGFSAGLVISVDGVGKSAEVVANYTLPGELNMLSASQGSMQLLPNGNVMIGWGSQPYYSEFDQKGALLYHAKFGAGVTNMMNYRAYKYEWTGKPSARPDLVSYAKVCEGTVFGYVSWNGATEVVGWRFRGTDDGQQKKGWRVLANVKKNGFETMTFLSGNVNGSAKYVAADAMGPGGRVLGVSNVVKTFVPSQQIVGQNNCTALGCEAGTDYGALMGQSIAEQC